MGIIIALVLIAFGIMNFRDVKDAPMNKKIQCGLLCTILAALAFIMISNIYQNEQIMLANQKAEWEIHPEIFWVRCHGANKAFNERGQLWVFYTKGTYEPRNFVEQRNDTLYFTEGILPIRLYK